MKEYSIGFRVKFDNIKSENIAKFVIDFLSKFDRYEIKVTNNIISSGKIYPLLEISEKFANGKYSLHLPKDVLSNAQAYAEIQKLIGILQNHKSTEKVHLITHIPYGDFQRYLGYILNIAMKLPENYILLLENEEFSSNNYNYLMQINELCALLCKQGITNVGICLDIGHLLFGFHKEGIKQEACLIQLEKMSSILSMIKEIHIHDYLNTDHLQLGKGIMDLECVLEFIVKNSLFVPLIIETTVKQPEHDGKEQILKLRSIIRSI